MKDGEIVEEGTHTSLLEDYPDGVYSQFFKEQSGPQVDQKI